MIGTAFPLEQRQRLGRERPRRVVASLFRGRERFGVQPNRLVAFDPAQKKFTESFTIAADKANTIRHMTFDKASRKIWFGGDANMIGSVTVAPQPLVP